MKQIAPRTAIVLLTLTVVAIAWQLRSVVLLFIVSLTVAAALDEPISWLGRRGWPRVWAILVVYIGVFGALTGLIAFIFMPTVSELDPLVQDLLAAYERIQTQLLSQAGSRPSFATRLPTTDQLATWLAAGETGVLVRSLVGLTQSVGGVLGQFVLAVVVAVYWTADRLHFERLWLSLLAPEQRGRARTFWRRLEADVGAYIRSEVIQSMLAGALLMLGYWGLGVKYPFTLALVGALAWLLPLVGGFLALLPVVIVGWLTGPMTALLAVVYTIVVLILMEWVVERRLYTHERYWGVLIVLVMLAMGDTFGLVGLLVAPPIAVALQIGLNEIFSTPATPEEQVSGLDLAELQGRVGLIRERITQASAPASARLTNLVERLDHLITEVEKSSAR
jgi:putative permease